MGTPAQFPAEIADGDNPYRVAVLLFKERGGAFANCLIPALHISPNVDCLEDLVVHDVLDLRDLFGAEALKVRKVEPEPVSFDERTRLLHVITEDRTEGVLQKVRCRVIPRNRPPLLGINRESDCLSSPE